MLFWCSQMCSILVQAVHYHIVSLQKPTPRDRRIRCGATMGNLRSLQLRMEIDKHSCQSIEHASQIALSSYGTCCRFCIPQLSTLYWCQTIQKASWARRRDSGWFQRRFCAVGPPLYSTVVHGAWSMWSFQTALAPGRSTRNIYLLVSDALAGRALEFSRVSRVRSLEMDGRFVVERWKSQPSLRVGHEIPKVLEGKNIKNMLDLQTRRTLWDNITPVNLFVMAFSLNIWKGFSTHTHAERAFCRTCVAKLICHILSGM